MSQNILNEAILQKNYNLKQPFDFLKIRMANKTNNSTGLQLADLIARPIGLSVIRPEQDNQSFDIIKTKLHKYNGCYKEAGLKIFP